MEKMLVSNIGSEPFVWIIGNTRATICFSNCMAKVPSLESIYLNIRENSQFKKREISFPCSQESEQGAEDDIWTEEG
jgi:hypothetical protein